jgi:hypothetical protein
MFFGRIYSKLKLEFVAFEAKLDLHTQFRKSIFVTAEPNTDYVVVYQRIIAIMKLYCAATDNF